MELFLPTLLPLQAVLSSVLHFLTASTGKCRRVLCAPIASSPAPSFHSLTESFLPPQGFFLHSLDHHWSAAICWQCARHWNDQKSLPQARSRTSSYLIFKCFWLSQVSPLSFAARSVLSFSQDKGTHFGTYL